MVVRQQRRWTKGPPVNRAALATGALIAALALAGCGTEDSAPAPTTTAAAATSETATEPTAAPAADIVEAAFTVTGGARTEGPERLEVRAGQTVRIIVDSDTADEVHVHGYDLYLPLEPGTQAELEFTADLSGVYEVELHDAGGLLTQLRVS